jgi:hypothetical protein
MMPDAACVGGRPPLSIAAIMCGPLIALACLGAYFVFLSVLPGIVEGLETRSLRAWPTTYGGSQDRASTEC